METSKTDNLLFINYFFLVKVYSWSYRLSRYNCNKSELIGVVLIYFSRVNYDNMHIYNQILISTHFIR